MSAVERTPMKIPLKCFGLEHDKLDPLCHACPHQQECVRFMGTRANKIPLDKLHFDLVPQELKVTLSERSDDSDRLIRLRLLYAECYRTVFGKDPDRLDAAEFYRDEIINNAHAAECSVRMFILSNMVAHNISEQTIIEQTSAARTSIEDTEQVHDPWFCAMLSAGEQPTIENPEKTHTRRFCAKLLTGERAINRAVEYAESGNDRYGTFSLYSLAAFDGANYEANEMDNAMLTSEVTAGRFLVRYNIHHGGPPFEALYREEELQLDPFWLATEPSYRMTVLDPSLKSKTGSRALKEHRLNVLKAIARFRRRRTTHRLAFQSRQKIMPEAVERVLGYFHMRPEDLLHDAVLIVDPLALWIQIGSTLQQYHCWLLVKGESSYFAH